MLQTKLLCMYVLKILNELAIQWCHNFDKLIEIKETCLILYQDKIKHNMPYTT